MIFKEGIELEKIKTITKSLKNMNFLNIDEDPHLIGVLIQPSFLIVPELGKLAALNVKRITNDQMSWEECFDLLESVIELKLVLGTATKIILLLDVNSNFDKKSDPVIFLKKIVDEIVFHSGKKNDNDLSRRLRKTLKSKTKFNDNIQYFWKKEQLRIVEKSLGRNFLKPNQPEPILLKNQKEAELYLSNELRLYEGNIIKNFQVHNVKHWFLQNQRSYYFEFDFTFQVNDNYYVFEVVNFSNKEMMNKIRAFISKTRLLNLSVNDNGALVLSYQNIFFKIAIFIKNQKDFVKASSLIEDLSILGVDAFILGYDSPIGRVIL